MLTTYLLCTGMLLALTVVAVFFPRIPAVLGAYGAMWLCRLSGFALFDNNTMIFWGVATLLVLGLQYLLPRAVAFSRVGVPFISGGAIVGAIVGLLFNTVAGIILGAVAGAFFGGVAFANSRTGREILLFPSRKFFNYLAAKGFPAVITCSMAALCLSSLITLNPVR